MLKSTANYITDTGIELLKTALKVNTTLTELDLRCKYKKKEAHEWCSSTIHPSLWLWTTYFNRSKEGWPTHEGRVHVGDTDCCWRPPHGTHTTRLSNPIHLSLVQPLRNTPWRQPHGIHTTRLSNPTHLSFFQPSRSTPWLATIAR